MLINSIQAQYPNKSHKFYESAYNISMLYCVRYYDAFEFQSHMKTLLTKNSIRESSKMFRCALVDDSYFILNLKLFVAEYCIKGYDHKVDRSEILESIAKYNIDRADFVLLLRMLSNKSNERIIKRQFKTYTLESLVTPLEAKNEFGAMYDTVMGYCRNITFRKLTFIVNSNNMTPQDMHLELMYKAVKTYYSMLPTHKEPLHIINYVKRAVHNHAMNIIKKYKFAKRDRLQSTIGSNGEYSFSMITVSENQMRIANDDDNDIGSLCALSGSCIEVGYDLYDIESTIKKILKIYKNKPRRLLQLIIGDYDADFTNFLKKKRKVTKNTDNTALYNTNIEEYKDLACNYLNIKRTTCDRFLKHVYSKHL